VVLYNLQDSYNHYISTIFSVSVVLICSFFMLNLLLAVVMDSFKNQVSPEETRRQIDEV